MPKKIVFISLPMSGYTKDEIKTQIEQAKMEYLVRFGLATNDVLFMDNADPAVDINPYASVDQLNVYYLGRALKRIASCHEVFFYGNWKLARGCLVEHYVCDTYKIPFVEV